MIIRKPYAFLIKNFKLIHFFMFILTSYLIFRANRIFSFFNEYVGTRQVISTGNLANSYVPNILFIFSFLVIIFSIIIAILLKQKDKPKLLYIWIIIFYFSFVIFSIVSKVNISIIELEGMDPQKARIIRDICLIFFLVQIAFEALLLVRSVGFDIKKFHFGEDLQALDIDISDNEEVELTTGIDTDKLIRNLKMKSEDLKVFFLENKLIIILIMSFILVIIPSTIIFSNTIKNKVYSENQTINTNVISITAKESYLTKYDYKGKKLLMGDSSYLILKLSIKNISKEDISLDLNKYKLEINNNIYNTNITLYDSFIDIGNGYISQKILPDETKEFVLLFVVNDKDVNNNIIFRYNTSIVYKNSEAKPNYVRFKLNPISLDNIENVSDIKLKQTLTFDNSLLSSTNINIDSYEINNKYSYEISGNTKYITNNLGKVMRLSYKFNIDDNVKFISNFSDFINKYGLITYIYEEKEYKIYVRNITPNDYDGSYSFVSVDDNIINATSIKFAFKIRNINYTYVLK